MIDFHSHILPGIDDGSASAEESLEMLRLSESQGITKIVATPHFYAEKESPEHFLKRRSRAWNQLAGTLVKERAVPEINPGAAVGGERAVPEIDPGAVVGRVRKVPEIYLGAEVCYYAGISHTKDLERLCIGDTQVLLLEMPFHKWPGRMVDEVIELARNTDLTILLAHIDRYLSWHSSDTWDALAEEGILFQVNASCFLDGWLSQRKALRLLREGRIAVLGSDCHNMTSRKPNLGEAIALIGRKEGEDAVREINGQAERLLGIRPSG